MGLAVCGEDTVGGDTAGEGAKYAGERGRGKKKGGRRKEGGDAHYRAGRRRRIMEEKRVAADMRGKKIEGKRKEKGIGGLTTLPLHTFGTRD